MKAFQTTGSLKLEDLGYDSFFASSRSQLGLDDFSIARVIAEHKGAYNVINQKGVSLAKISGKQMFDAVSREDYPAVGDWVAITELEPGKALVHKVLPRKTVIKRKVGDKNKIGGKTGIQVIGANIDAAFIVEAVGRDFNLNRFERYFVLVKNGGVKPAIVLNKIDLISEQELDFKLSEIKNRFSGLEVIPASVVNEGGLDKLRTRVLPGKTYCFLGSSGVGKSSLINRLIGENLIRTGLISPYSGRGKHVTTSREMYFLENGAIVIDNPGIREVGMVDDGAGLDSQFEQIAALAGSCKYADCTHIHEPDCAVLAAVKEKMLDEDKYRNFISLRKETEYSQMSSLEKRQKDRRFGKFIKQAKKDIKKYRY